MQRRINFENNNNQKRGFDKKLLCESNKVNFIALNLN